MRGCAMLGMNLGNGFAEEMDPDGVSSAQESETPKGSAEMHGNIYP